MSERHRDVPGTEQTGLETETQRIRDAYARRDSRAVRSTPIQHAYALLNEERRAKTLELIRQLVADEDDPHPTLLDVGCGSGLDLADLLARGWPATSLAGVDLVEQRIEAARVRCPGVTLMIVDGARLPFEDASFRIATAVTVFSSILSADARQALFAEMTRVVIPGGHVLVYDFVVRKPGNRDVLAMPLRRLLEFAGRHPDHSMRLSPFLYAVGAAGVAGPRAARAAMRLAPPTHRLSAWRRSGDSSSQSAAGGVRAAGVSRDAPGPSSLLEMPKDIGDAVRPGSHLCQPLEVDPDQVLIRRQVG